ncbi:MAG: glycoside hydrolase [Sphingobacteriaceae bacterium]|nr:glycoside hydrolase [Sphingobacteriaceae bacterium]
MKNYQTGGSTRTTLLSLGLLAVSLLFTQCKKNELSKVEEQAPAPKSAAKVSLTRSPTSGFLYGHGVNLQPSYYNNGNVNFGWSLMKSYTKIKTVRIEVEPDKVNQAKSWISQANANGYAVIVTYHRVGTMGSDNTAYLNDAANWWRTNYATLWASGRFTINLMNEWGSHNISSNAYASAYNSAISTVRQVYSGAIIIDIPGWGQETRTAADAVKGTNGTRINDANIILSAHIYPNGWNQGRNRTLANADLDEMGSAGRACMIGEFGNQPSGSANWSGLVNHAKSKGWTVLGWAWNGDGGGMNMVSPSWAQNATATSFSPSGYFNTVYNLL